MRRDGGEVRRLSFDRDVTFGLVPRINAVGRMGDANLAVALLCEADPDKAMDIARELDRQNGERRLVEEVIFEECRRDLSEEDYAFCAYGPSWHEGVIGIACSRLRQDLNRPVALIAGDREIAKGSARGIPGFDVHRALDRCKEALETFGGHEGAAGFSIRKENVEGFLRLFRAASEEQLRDHSLERSLRLEAVLSLPAASSEGLEPFCRLEPFGQENPVPQLACLDCRVEAVNVVGKSRNHLQVILSKDGASRRFVWFGKGDLAGSIALFDECDAAFVPNRGTYMGKEEISPLLRDMRPAWSACGLRYSELAKGLRSSGPTVLYTFSADAAWSVWSALVKEKRDAVVHTDGHRGALGHDARLALGRAGGIVISTAPWALPLGTGDGPALVLVHPPSSADDAARLDPLVRSLDAYLWEEGQDDGALWLTWTYPEKEEMERLWNCLRAGLSGGRAPLVNVGRAWAGLLEASAGRRLAEPRLYRDGARALLGSVLRIVGEVGLAAIDFEPRSPVLATKPGHGRPSLSSSAFYCRGKIAREGFRHTNKVVEGWNLPWWRGAL